MKFLASFLILTSIFCWYPEADPPFKERVPKWLVKIDEGLYMDRFETTIRDYMHFVGDQRDSLSLQASLPYPNTVNWYEEWAWKGDTFKKRYYYRVYETDEARKSIGHLLDLWYKPIVNISPSQAKAYCKWLNKYEEERFRNASPRKRRRWPKLHYRLPTMEEWRSAASGGLNPIDFPYGIKDTSDRMPVSIACFGDLNKTIPDGGSKEFPTSMRNELGISNMVSDVAELVSDANLVLGGSYLSPLSECKVLSTRPYLKPEQDIGFRVVAEIVTSD